MFDAISHLLANPAKRPLWTNHNNEAPRAKIRGVQQTATRAQNVAEIGSRQSIVRSPFIALGTPLPLCGRSVRARKKGLLATWTEGIESKVGGLSKANH